jgi:hypothetical protein
MEKLSPNTWAWIALVITVILSTAGDSLSTLWWKNKSWWLGGIIVVIAPIAYFSIGYVGHRFALSIASCLANSLIMIGPVLVGLFIFSEWKKMSPPLYGAILLIITGFIIIVIFKKAD